MGKALLKSVTEVAVINIIIGFLIPNIDNVAHISGLISGIIITYLTIKHFNLKNDNFKIMKLSKAELDGFLVKKLIAKLTLHVY